MLSNTNLRTFNVIRDLIALKGFSPTIKEIAQARGLSETAITKHIVKLMAAKVIDKAEGKKSRTIRVII